MNPESDPSMHAPVRMFVPDHLASDQRLIGLSMGLFCCLSVLVFLLLGVVTSYLALLAMIVPQDPAWAALQTQLVAWRRLGPVVYLGAVGFLGLLYRDARSRIQIMEEES